MKRKIKINLLLLMLSLIVPLVSFSQEDGTTNRSIDYIDPPPTPIDDYVISFAVVAILIAAFYFYKTNFKTETK